MNRTLYLFKTSIVPRSRFRALGTMLIYKHCSTRSKVNAWNNACIQALFHAFQNYFIKNIIIFSRHRKLFSRYQFGAFLMAVYLKNMTVDETISMAKYMLRSGDRISWHQFSQPMVDVHLAPCVGDSTLLSLAPCLAAVGLKIPSFDDQAAINKLKTIPGYDPNLLTDTKEVRNVLKSVGCFIGAATEKIVPAEEMFKKNLANKIVGYLAKCEFCAKIGFRFWILVEYVYFFSEIWREFSILGFRGEGNYGLRINF